MEATSKTKWKALLMIILTSGIISVVEGQKYIKVDDTKASACSGTQYFDTAELACKSCPQNTVPIANSKLIFNNN